MARWTEKQKQDVLTLAEVATIREAAEKFGVPEGTIKRWRSEQRTKERTELKKKTKRTEPKRERTKPNQPEGNKVKQEKKEAPDLTEKQVLFVAEYLTDFNATRAAMAVGYSKKTAGQIGWQLLQKPLVQEEIKRQTEIVANSLGITSQRILLEYLKIAFSDITEYVSFGQKEVPVIGAFGPVVDKETGKPVTKIVNVVEFKESVRIDGSIIKEVKQGKDGASIKLQDKMKALEKLEKYLDLLPDQHQRMIQEEKLKLERERFEHTKAMDEMKVF